MSQIRATDETDNVVVGITIDTDTDPPVFLTIEQARNLYNKLRDIFEPNDYKKFTTWLKRPDVTSSPTTVWSVDMGVKEEVPQSPPKKATRKKVKK